MESEPNRPKRSSWILRPLLYLRQRPLIALSGTTLCFAMIVNPGCISTVRAPETIEGEACTVYVVTAALHKGLILPGEGPDQWHEYGFGELEWYGRGNDPWYRVFPTILWPTLGCLGTRAIAATNEDQLLQRSSGSELSAVRVSSALAKELRSDLEQAFSDGAADRFTNADYGLDFVPQSSYWGLNNCHDKTADWMTQLGCTVSWWPMRLQLNVISE